MIVDSLTIAPTALFPFCGSSETVDVLSTVESESYNLICRNHFVFSSSELFVPLLIAGIHCVAKEMEKRIYIAGSQCPILLSLILEVHCLDTKVHGFQPPKIRNGCK